MTQTFENWTEYDDWLIQNYDAYSIYKVDEKDGKIFVEYMEKEEWEKLQKEKKV